MGVQTRYLVMKLRHAGTSQYLKADVPVAGWRCTGIVRCSVHSFGSWGMEGQSPSPHFELRNRRSMLSGNNAYT